MAYTQFDRVPNHYAGPIIQKVKDFRLANGKRSLSPTLLEICQLQVLIPRHFGFCFGVERAIHMAFSTLEKNPEHRTFLVSEIIHNPLVNNELKERGIEFIYDAEGRRQVSADELSDDDIALIPAFGTTLQIEDSLKQSGIDTSTKEYRESYDTTCPFVSKVWKRGEELGREGYTIIIHGKYKHEETQATHSHTKEHTKTLVVLDEAEAKKVAAYITGEMALADFERQFAGMASEHFDPERDLKRVAVVNQTTMLADETKQVTETLREAMRQRYGEENLDYHCADTNDTLCYATNQNQNATRALLRSSADLALIVGGYNSSNTAHLVEICSEIMPSFLIANSDEILSQHGIRHFDIHAKQMAESQDWLPGELPVRLIITSGASCPDILMNQVLQKVADFYGYSEAEIAEANLSLFEEI
ncbi:MAG: 4-hydroxy-3-methylbut-2-enyl diphosphate reductase [Candidatus Latescibacterota bacterium]|nr:4-hydroxy-3-methylbut-2-enyl diphosphate reductase [Candidatus Latescibacterota bacterium]